MATCRKYIINVNLFPFKTKQVSMQSASRILPPNIWIRSRRFAHTIDAVIQVILKLLVTRLTLSIHTHDYTTRYKTFFVLELFVIFYWTVRVKGLTIVLCLGFINANGCKWTFCNQFTATRTQNIQFQIK